MISGKIRRLMRRRLVLSISITLLSACGGDGTRDTGSVGPSPDAGRRDAAPPRDAARPDAPRAPDGGIPDAAPADGPPDAAPPADGPLEPTLLSQTGLYTDVAAGTLADGVEAYAPRFQLWSDGAAKRRWIRLPPGAQIDTSAVDHWVFPPGTRLWKEFSRDGRRVETRLLYKTGPSRSDWFMMAYLWNEAGTDAEAVPGGARDARGTMHDVPAQNHCAQCHNGVPDRVLGFGAVQLGDALDGLDLAELVAAGRLTAPPERAALPVPDDASGTAAAALGYLHGNCGGCHNPRSPTHVIVDLDLRLTVASLARLADTPAYRTAVGQALSMPFEGATARIQPGDPAASAVHLRMAARGQGQMPPIGTELVDAEGAAAVDAWIRSLP